ncbi:hypothetical protein [Kocuria rosea]|uniref:hypothetical protein n=1 Tax=Kocuria rosea TaxID=1275 RepID=UPI00232C4DBE|nr:hypothetical protein [Kocuria rosea]
MFALDTPDTTLDAYWATAAQILALLSLAVVVEARAVQRRWSSVPAPVQLMQGAIWFSVLSLAAFLLPSALEASRPDRSQPDWMPEVTQLVIMYSVAMLVLGPAVMFLVVGSAESVYAVRGFSPRARWQAWQHARKSRRLLKQDEEQARLTQRLVEITSAARERIEGDQRDFRKKVEAGLTIMRDVEMSPEDADQMMAWVEWHIIKDFEGSVLLQKGEEHVGRMQQSLLEAPARSAEIAQLVENAEHNRRRLRSTSRQLTKARAALFRSYFTTPEPAEGMSPKV